MKHWRIAVITPVYNDALGIQQAIECVRNQTISAVHFIYNDASIDNTTDVLTQLSHDPNIRIITAQTNQGQSFARNHLLQLALDDNFDIVAFLDSDDCWEPNHLASSLAALDQNDLVYSMPVLINQHQQFMDPINIPIPTTFVGKQLLFNNFIYISSVVARIGCFYVNTFDSELDSIEDWDMWLRLWNLNYKFVRNPQTTVRYLVKDSGQASQGSQKFTVFKDKHSMLPTLKLHLACGLQYLDDYINLDLYPDKPDSVDLKWDISELPWPNNCIDEIRAFHIIEHFDFYQTQQVLNEWYRVLKPGGRLYLETPDLLNSCQAFVDADENQRIDMYGHFFATPWIPGQTHKFLFTQTQLECQLIWCGFTHINRLEPASNYVNPDNKHLFLTVEAWKSN